VYIKYTPRERKVSQLKITPILGGVKAVERYF